MSFLKYESRESLDWFEEHLRSKLKERKLSIAEFASKLKVSRSSIYNLFNKKGGLKLLKRVAKELNIPLQDLLSDTIEKDSPLPRDQLLLKKYRIADARIRDVIDSLLGLTRPEENKGLPLVIVVDDIEENVDLYKRVLRDLCKVQGFVDVKEALDFAKQNKFDAVLSDQKMPNMTGTQFLTEIKAISGDIPKVIVSAYSDVEAFLDAINQAQVSAFLIKPVSPDTLRTRMKTILTTPSE